jgi:hypothetical protein
LVNPCVVELHPARLVGTEMAGFDIFPEALALEVLARLRGVDRPFALGGQPEELNGAYENRARGRVEMIFAFAEPKDDRAKAEHDSG